MNDDHLASALLYVSGELPVAASAAFERHRADCAECRDLLALSARGRAWAAALEEGPAPETLAALFVRPARRPWVEAVRILALSAAACAAVLVAFRGGPEPDLSWRTDLGTRLAALEGRLEGARASAGKLRMDMKDWSREVTP